MSLGQPRIWAVLTTIAFTAVGVVAQEAGAQPGKEALKKQILEAAAEAGGQQQNREAAPAPRISVEPEIFNFGEVWQGATASGEFTIKNNGNAPLTISARSSCGCTVATTPKSPLAPGESTTFSITYNTSRPGVANKKVTLTTNDPTNKSVVIDVRGRVNALYEATPTKRLLFRDLSTNSTRSETITITSKYDQPLTLKVRENQEMGAFVAEVKEVEPGKVFELRVSTKPPLKSGRNFVNVVLETGLEKVPTISFPVTAMVPPRVAVTPQKLYVNSHMTRAIDRLIRLQYRADDPVEVQRVEAIPETIAVEVIPTAAPKPNELRGYQQIKVSLPKYEDVPENAKLIIHTDDPSGEFATVEVPIIKAPARRALSPGRHLPKTSGHALGNVKKSARPAPKPGKAAPEKSGASQKPENREE